MQLQGEIEVLLEDQKGRIKTRESHKNTITDAYLRYVFYSMMLGGSTDNMQYGPTGLAAVLRSSQNDSYLPNSNFISRAAPSEFGIYAMNKTIDIQPDTFVPPYVAGNHTTLDSSVTFYNANGASSENSQVMLPSPSGCYYDNKNYEFQTEYVKNNGTGTVQSVCIGRNHIQREYLYFLKMSDSHPAADWNSGNNTAFMLEHGTDFTKVWRYDSYNHIYRCDFKTKTVETLTGTELSSNMGSYPWLVTGNAIFRVERYTTTSSTHVVRLYYRNNFRTSTTEAYKDITFTKRSNATLRTDTYPVLVYRPDTDKLEIYETLSIGNHTNGGYGCNVWKATVDGLSTPASMTSTLTDMGVLPYGISTSNVTDYNSHYTGLYYSGKLFLPYRFYTENDNTYEMSNSSYCPGVVISPDLTAADKLLNYQNNQNYNNIPVICADGVKQFVLTEPKMPQIYMSQIVSGTNLASPITKAADDVLKIRYKYKLQ